MDLELVIAIVYKVTIGGFIVAFAKYLPQHKISLKLGLIIILGFWAVGWDYATLKPSTFPTLYAEMCFTVGYVIIYFISISTLHPPRKVVYLLWVVFGISLILSLFFSVKSDPLVYIISVIFLQMLIKILLITQTQSSFMGHRFKWIYKHFWYLSITNNIAHIYFLNNIDEWYLFLNLRSVWEILVILLSSYTIFTYYKYKRVT